MGIDPARLAGPPDGEDRRVTRADHTRDLSGTSPFSQTPFR